MTINITLYEYSRSLEFKTQEIPSVFLFVARINLLLKKLNDQFMMRCVSFVVSLKKGEFGVFNIVNKKVLDVE